MFNYRKLDGNFPAEDPLPQPQIGSPYELIDGATANNLEEITHDLQDLSKIVLNTSLDMQDRLDAYEDIIDSEVGDTNIIRVRNMEREIGLRQIYLKFEGGNPTGTQKDRIAFAQCADALRRGFDTITLATCGNYGVSCALAARLSGLKCVIFVPETYHTKRIHEMEELGAEIIRVDGDYEFSVNHSKLLAEKHEMYDANPGGINTTLQLRAYGEIAYEIYDELRDAPRVVAVPVSNGTLLAGIYKGFLSLYRRGKTSRMPFMVAGSAFGKNPIVQASILNTLTCEDLAPDQIKETLINEPLINWHSFDGDAALDAIRTTKGWASWASDKTMLNYSKFLREKEGMHVLPASTAGLVSLINRHKKEPLENDRFVVILTGRR